MRSRLASVVVALAAVGHWPAIASDAWRCALPMDGSGDVESPLIPDGSPVSARVVFDILDPSFNDVIDLGASEIRFDGNDLTIELGVKDLSAQSALRVGGVGYVFTWHSSQAEGLPAGFQPLYVDGVRAVQDLAGWRFQWHYSRGRGWEDASGVLDWSRSSVRFTVPYDVDAVGTRLDSLDGFAYIRNTPSPRIEQDRLAVGEIDAGLTVTSYDHVPFYDPALWFGWPSLDVELGGECASGTA